jgi:hypothetical protein
MATVNARAQRRTEVLDRVLRVSKGLKTDSPVIDYLAADDLLAKARGLSTAVACKPLDEDSQR